MRLEEQTAIVAAPGRWPTDTTNIDSLATALGLHANGRTAVFPVGIGGLAAALGAAHEALRSLAVDLAIVRNGPVRELIALRRANEAVGCGDRISGLLGVAIQGRDVGSAATVADLPHGPDTTAGERLRWTEPPEMPTGGPTGPQVLFWSAVDSQQEAQRRQALARWVGAADDDRFPAAVHHWNARTRCGAYRGALVADTAAETVTALSRATASARDEPRPIAFLLPGQGAQHEGMAVGLYDTEPVFAAAMDAVFEMMGAEGRRVRADWLSDRPAVPMDEVTRAQPLLFAVDHALARLVMSWGVRPSAILGHSVGEVVGAVLAGVLDLADGVRLQMDRVGQMGAGPAGGMLAVAASADQVRPYLSDEVVIGVINGPRQVLLAGPEKPLVAVTEALSRDGFTTRRARALHGFHSPSLAGATERSLPVVSATRLRPPGCTFYSAYTETELTTELAVSPRFWASQPSAPVHFGPALSAMLARRSYLLVEAGPGQGLTALARRHAEVASGRSDVVGLLPARPGTARDDRRAMLEAAARLWAEGHALSWAPPLEQVPALVG